MNKSDRPAVFGFSDYKLFIREQLNANSNKGGYQGKMADAARCRKSYFSRVLSTKAQLSQEQALRLAEFWMLNDVQTEYFLTLVGLGRTDDPDLLRRLRKHLQALKEQTENLSKRFSEASGLGRERDVYYYSSWYPAAIHVLIGIPGFQTVETISGRLRVPPAIIAENLSTLESLGLAKFNGKHWTRTSGHLHLTKESPLIGVHHSHWREKAVEASRNSKADGLHYTLIQSHSLDDFDRIKQEFLKSVDRARDIMRPSPNEELTCISLDFFRVS